MLDELPRRLDDEADVGESRQQQGVSPDRDAGDHAGDAIAALRARGDAFEVTEENLTNYTALWRPWDEFVSGRATLYPNHVLRLLPGV